MRVWPLVLLVAGCSAPPPVPPPEPQPTCRVAPLSISTHDQLTPATLREIRRVNRDLRRHCAG